VAAPSAAAPAAASAASGVHRAPTPARTSFTAPRPEPDDDEEEEEEEEEESGGAMLWIVALVATAVVFGLALYTAWNKSTEVQSAAENVMSFRMNFTFRFFLTVVVIAAVLGGIVGGIARAMQKPFGRIFAIAYSVAALVVAGLALSGVLTSKVPGFEFLAPAAPAPKAAPAKKVAEVRKEAAKLVKEAAAEPAKPPELGTVPKNATLPANDDERVENLKQVVVAEIGAAQTEYVTALDKSGLHHFLDPPRLAADTSFKESRAMVSTVKEAIKRTRKRINDAINSVPQKIEALHLEPAVAKEMIATVKQAFSTTLPLVNEKWDLEEEIADHFEEIINFMQANQGFWSLQDGKFAFQRNSDRNRFTELAREIDQCAARQTEIQSQMMAAANSAAGEAKSTAP
jgi:hypothetical protein